MDLLPMSFGDECDSEVLHLVTTSTIFRAVLYGDTGQAQRSRKGGATILPVDVQHCASGATNDNKSQPGIVRDACVRTNHTYQSPDRESLRAFSLGRGMARSSFSITLDRSGLDAAIDENINRQLPFIVSRALNDTAKNARDALRTAMPQYFDRPTPYTMNSVRITYATKSSLVATVGYKDESFKGTPATKYLLPEVEGGNRNVKRMEQSLRRIGLLPADMYVVPGSAAKLDQYGNVSRGQIVQVLAYLQAFGEQGYRANTTAKRRDRLARGSKNALGYSYFVLQRREGKLLPGIYLRTHYGSDPRIAHLAYGAAKPVFIFVNAPRYTQRFPFDAIVGRAVEANLDANAAAAFALAVSTKR